MRVPGKGTMTHIENREARPPHALLRTFLTQPFLLPVSDNSIGGRQVMVAWDRQSGASAATLVAYGTVPTIVPETRQNSVSEANASQLVRSGK
jgi:hypothetical protein